MKLCNCLNPVLLVTWVCLLNHANTLPLTFSPTSRSPEPAHRTPSTRLSRVFPASNQTQALSNEDGQSDSTPPQEQQPKLDFSKDSIVHERITKQITEVSNLTDISNSSSGKHDKPNIIVLKSHEGPLVLKGENDTNIYVLAHVLDMEKGLYYIPTNQTANSTEGWVFWKIPHLYKLGNPPSDTSNDVPTADTSSEDSNHGFYVLMLGLGCFVCGLMVMLILTLVILTRRFSNRTRPPARSFNPDPVVEVDPYEPKYSERFPHPYYCENMDYYSMPYGPGVPRLRRFSSDDAIEILRRRAEPALPPHFCACQRCYYDDGMMTPPEDDDVPLIDLNNDPNDLIYDYNNTEVNSRLSGNTNERNSLTQYKDVHRNAEHLLLATKTGIRPIEDAPTQNNDVSNNRPRCTSTECEEILSKNSRNVIDGILYINSYDKRSHPYASEPWIELSAARGRLLGQTVEQHRGENGLLKPLTVSTIGAISCAAVIDGRLSEPNSRPEKSLDDVTVDDVSQARNQDTPNNLSSSSGTTKLTVEKCKAFSQNGDNNSM